MSLRQIGDSRRERAEEMGHPIGRFSVNRRRFVKERLERHADNVRRPATEAARCSPECATERCGHTDGDLIFQGTPSNCCTAIVMQRTAACMRTEERVTLGEAVCPKGTFEITNTGQKGQCRAGGAVVAAMFGGMRGS